MTYAIIIAILAYLLFAFAFVQTTSRIRVG